MPMKTFRLREGGLALSQYAYYRLQRITADRDRDGNKIKDSDTVLKDIIRRRRAREYLRNFGSHIPFGVQTLGGVFLRRMKITTETETSLSSLYNTATAQLTMTNSTASTSTTTATARKGLFGLGGSVTTSHSHSKATSSGFTVVNSTATGSGNSEQKTNAHYESNVTCFGPNAATQDDLYLQLVGNNATWTVIDRGEPDSYFAIWDLVDYYGSGGMLKDECKLLREAWEEMALANSAVAEGNANELLDIVMKDYEIKLKMYNFVQACIFCLVPKNGCRYDADLAENFEKIISLGCNEIAEDGGIFDPTQLIESGVAKASTDAKFDLVPGNQGYYLAKTILNETTSTDWANYFTYYSDTFRAEIIEKGKPSYLFDVCRVCCLSEEENSWELVYKIVNPDLSKVKSSTERLFKEDLRSYLTYKDEESGNYCLHLVIQSNNLKLVDSVHTACPRIASIKNRGEGDKEGQSPKELAKDYSNLQHYLFPEHVFEGDTKVWAVDSDNNVNFLADEKSKTWKRFGDVQIKHISTSNNAKDVWGVGITGSAHYLSRTTSSEWKTISCPGILDSIAVSADGNHVWAIDIDGNIYRAFRDGDEWDFGKDIFEKDDVKIKLRSISVSGDGSKVCGINREDGYCVMKMPMEDKEWKPHGVNGISVERVSISPNGNLLYFTDWDGNLYRYFMGNLLLVDKVNEGKKLRHVVVDNGANVWGTGLDNDGTVWYRDYNDCKWKDKVTSDETSH